MTEWQILKIVLTILALLLLAATGLVLVRLKGVLSWNRSLTSELATLERMALKATGRQRQGIEVVTTRCRNLLRSINPALDELGELKSYIRSIAACYHPDSATPELNVSVGALLKSAENSMDRLDLILKRPGFGKLEKIKIRDIKTARKWLLRLNTNRLWKWYSRHHRNIKRLGYLRLLLPDPLGWVTFLSQRLTLLLLYKFFLADLYLFCGRMTLDAFDRAENFIHAEGQAELEDTLETLSAHRPTTRNVSGDPRIAEIRQELVGLPKLLWATPSLSDGKSALHSAAGIIAQNYFPEAETPLEEAALGPLVQRSRAWIAGISRGQDLAVTRRLYGLKLETLVNAKKISDLMLPPAVRTYLGHAVKTYGHLKWPLRVYRWSRRISPWKVALQVGWTAAQRASVAYILGFAFDRACKELDSIYSLSKQLDAGGQKKEGPKIVR